MRLAATSGVSSSAASARWPKARRLWTRMLSLKFFRSVKMRGVLRAMHSEVLTTRKVRISRNHQAL